MILRFVSWILVGALVACGHAETRCDDGADNDGDSFVDCFDQDCAATCGEVCGNLLDDNDDGNVDCLDPLCGGVCAATPPAEDCGNAVDDDEDHSVDCEDDDCTLVCDTDADGWLDASHGGLDCDDDESSVHPGGDEIAYNGFDDDCDPITPDDDIDGDGFLLADDCDGAADGDAATYPGAPETCGDGVANDCYDQGALPADGYCYGDRTAGSADAAVFGPSPSGLAGFSVAIVPDLDRDGDAELFIGAYGDGADFVGAAYLVNGPAAGELDLGLADHKWVGETLQGWAGYAVGGGVDLVAPGQPTDGNPDLLITAPQDDQAAHDAGTVFVVPPAGASPTDLLIVDRKILGEGDSAYAGTAVAGLPDLGGDGYDDVIVGSPGASRDYAGGGAAHVVSGPILGSVDLNTVSYRIGGTAADEHVGCAVASAGDLDGDGLNDVLVSRCDGDGGVAAFTTHTAVDRQFTDGDFLMAGAANGLGASIAGADLDGDGSSDLIVGAPGEDAGAGAVYLVAGPAFPVTAVLRGEAAGDGAGASVSPAGDIDDDGAVDLIIGAPRNDLGGEDAGAAYVVFGPFGGDASLATADVRITGEAAFDQAGTSVAGGADVDDDGLPDVFVGAPYHDGLNPGAGAAYLFTFDW